LLQSWSHGAEFSQLLLVCKAFDFSFEPLNGALLVIIGCRFFPSIRLAAGFSAETLQARRGRHNIFQVMEGKNLHPIITSKAPFRGSKEKSKALQTSKS